MFVLICTAAGLKLRRIGKAPSVSLWTRREPLAGAYRQHGSKWLCGAARRQRGAAGS
jgi:hypothetical protein